MDIAAPLVVGPVDYVPAAGGGAMPLKLSVATTYMGGLPTFGREVGFHAKHMFSLGNQVDKRPLEQTTATELRRLYGDGASIRLESRLASLISINNRL